MSAIWCEKWSKLVTEALWSRELGLRSNFSDFEHDFDPFKLSFDSINTHEMAIYVPLAKNHAKLSTTD